MTRPVPVAIESGEVRSRRRDDPGQHPARRRSPAPPAAGRQPTVQAIAVLARAHQDAIWARSKACHQLRSLLREFFPTFLAIFTDRFTMGIASPEARAVLAIAPRPGAAAKLSVSRIGAALRRAGRSRGIDQTAAEINAGLRNPQLHQLLWSRLRWPTRAGSARGARHRVRRCRRPGSGVRGVVSDPSRLRDHHEFPRPGIRPDHPCVRTLDLGHPPPCQEQSAGQRRLDAGVLGCLQLASLPAGIIASGENTGTAMPPLPATCSTSSSANSTTASNIG